MLLQGSHYSWKLLENDSWKTGGEENLLEIFWNFTSSVIFYLEVS